MENLSFHLSEFDGPLDLLLHLISKNKVSIYNIPIAEILSQYMEYMPEINSCNVEQASEFASMAAKLIYIKSRLLLPKSEEPDEDGGDPRDELAEMLIEYQCIKELVPHLAERLELGRDVYVRERTDIAFEEYGEYVVYDYKASDLIKALGYIKKRTGGKSLLNRASPFSGIVGKQKVSVKDKSEDIIKLLSSRKRVKFKNFFGKAQGRAEIVAIFLAVLELLRESMVEFERDGNDYIFTMSEGGARSISAGTSDFNELSAGVE